MLMQKENNLLQKLFLLSSAAQTSKISMVYLLWVNTLKFDTYLHLIKMYLNLLKQ